MKILYLCHRFPFPPKRGGKIRPFNMIKALGEYGHQVTVASLVRSPDEAEEARGIEEFCSDFKMARVHNPLAWVRMIAYLPTLTPSSMGYFFSANLHRSIRKLIAEQAFDLIFVHCSSVAQYVSDITGIPKILDFGDMDSQKWLSYSHFKPFPTSLGYTLEGKKLQREEAALTRRFDLCTCTTRAELETLNELADGCETGWFPNGVDTEYFSPGDGYDQDVVSFLGRMDYYPNQDAVKFFATQVFPVIRAARPSTVFRIVGAEPSADIKSLSDLDGIEVTGSVPDVRPFLRESVLTVAPLRIARGTQNKILESMAAGVPVVSSTLASKGVDCEPGEHLLTADDPASFARQCLRLLDDPEERKRFSEAGRARVMDKHLWQNSMRQMHELLLSCYQRARKRP